MVFFFFLPLAGAGLKESAQALWYAFLASSVRGLGRGRSSPSLPHLSVSTRVNLNSIVVTKITALVLFSNEPEKLAVAQVPSSESLSVAGVVAHVQGRSPESDVVLLLAERNNR